MEELVLYLSLKYEGDFNSIYKALMSKEEVDVSLKNRLFKRLRCQYTTIFSDDYPESLKHINCPPFVLYYYGDYSLLSNKVIAVIGMREPSQYGKEVTQSLTRDLVDCGYTIISGMARGIDGIAHQEAISQNGHTIAVLGCGIDYCYPLRHRQLYEEIKASHLLVSEYPFMKAPQQQLFPFRNRIIAGLSQSVVVMEAREKSGTMITVGYALEQGKDVYAIPSRIGDYNGCNKLIQQGAKMVLNIEDIVEDELMG